MTEHIVSYEEAFEQSQRQVFVLSQRVANLQAALDDQMRLNRDAAARAAAFQAGQESSELAVQNTAARLALHAEVERLRGIVTALEQLHQKAEAFTDATDVHDRLSATRRGTRTAPSEEETTAMFLRTRAETELHAAVRGLRQQPKPESSR